MCSSMHGHDMNWHFTDVLVQKGYLFSETDVRQNVEKEEDSEYKAMTPSLRKMGFSLHLDVVKFPVISECIFNEWFTIWLKVTILVKEVNIISMHQLPRSTIPSCKPDFVQSGELIVDLFYNITIIHISNSIHILNKIGMANHTWWDLSAFPYSYYVACRLFYVQSVFHERKENIINCGTACLANTPDCTAI